jgi:hypothetical protein
VPAEFSSDSDSFLAAGMEIASKITITDIITSNSVSVKARIVFLRFLIHFFFPENIRSLTLPASCCPRLPYLDNRPS